MNPISYAKTHTRKPTSTGGDSVLTNTTPTTTTPTPTTPTQQQALRKTRSRKSYANNNSPTQYDMSINANNNNSDLTTHHIRNSYDHNHDPYLYYIEEDDDHNPNNNDIDFYVPSDSGHPVSKSMWQALWLTSVPGELHEDLTDFSSQVFL